MNKKNLVILIILFIVGFVFSFNTQWEWAFQMLLAGLVMVVIIAVRSSKHHDDNIQTNLAELVTIFGITISPNLMDGVIPHLEKLRNWINTQGNFDWIHIGAYKNISYILLVAVMYFFVHLASKLFQDKTIMKKHRGKVLALFNNEDYKRRRNNFCNMLSNDIRSIDIDSQWNDYYFAPLEAEVIIEEFNRPKKKSSDLLKALRDRSGDNVVLILGDPGSGKSTVLRKLSKQLLDEVNKTNKIPLYVNLKEWNVDEVFNDKNPPQLHHLIDFIKRNLKTRLSDIWASEFISDYFNDLYEQGYLYFIFDSFDEIPMLLDETETSWLVDKVSALIYSVCSHNKNTKVILSSRYFRQPTEQFKTRVKMQIKPFSETSIKTCFHNFTNSNQLSLKLFSEHKEMMVIAKNPFYASLISLYYKDTKSLPSKEVDLYKSFIISRLNQCERVFGTLTANGLNVEQVISYAQDIAIAIFKNTNGGIEIPYHSIVKDNNIPEVVIDILQKSKLIRVGGGNKQAISFSHRRFNEYFVACSLMETDISSYLESIPTDSKWRDTLVLYAQICSRPKANELIEFCCSFFKKVKMVEDIIKIDEGTNKYDIKNTQTTFQLFIIRTIYPILNYLVPGDNEERPKRMRVVLNNDFRQALHSLRFLISAFSSQPQIVSPFQETIFEFTKILLTDRSILSNKLAMQSVPLLSNNNIEIVLEKVLYRNISWINTEAIQNCSFLNTISSTLMEKIMHHYSFMGLYDFIKGFGQSIFYLSLSKNFSKIRAFCIARFLNCIVAFIFIPILFLASSISSYSDFSLLFGSLKNIKNNSYYGWVILLGAWLLQSLMGFIANIVPFQLSRTIGNFKKLYFNPVFIIIFGIFSHNIYVFLACLLLPSKTDIAYYANMISCNYRSFFAKIRKIYRFLIVFVFTTIVFLIFIIIIEKISPIIMTCIILSVFSLTVITVFVVWLVKLLMDNKKFRNIEFFGSLDRHHLSKVLGDFQTAFYQRKYLVCLSEKNINVYGEWKDAKFPQVKDHDLDVMLAQLEEKWLGL